MSNSTCLRADLENSSVGSVNKSQAPSKKKPDGGLNEVAYSQPKATQKHHPLKAHSKHEGTNMKCKPNCAHYWQDPLANTGEPLRLDTGRILGRIHWQGILSGTRRDPLGSYSGILSGILGGISTGELLWRDTQRDPLATALAGYSAGPSSGGMLGGIRWRAALAGSSAESTNELLWRGYWVGAWCRSIANADSNIKSNNPFLSDGEKTQPNKVNPHRDTQGLIRQNADELEGAQE